MLSIRRCLNRARTTRKRPSPERGGPGTYRVRPIWLTSREHQREVRITKEEDVGPKSPSGRR
eukprot:7046239-Heterocapsa_arctica.AAC.1